MKQERIIPVGDFARYTDKPPIKPQTARLFAESGNWLLQYDDGTVASTHYASGPGQWRREDIIRMVTGKSNPTNRTIVLTLTVSEVHALDLQRFLEKCVTDHTTCGIADWLRKRNCTLQEYTVKEQSHAS